MIRHHSVFVSISIKLFFINSNTPLPWERVSLKCIGSQLETHGYAKIWSPAVLQHTEWFADIKNGSQLERQQAERSFDATINVSEAVGRFLRSTSRAASGHCRKKRIDRGGFWAWIQHSQEETCKVKCSNNMITGASAVRGMGNT